MTKIRRFPRIPLRFPRLNAVTKALLNEDDLKDHQSLHRALQRLDVAEKAGMDFYDGAKFL